VIFGFLNIKIHGIDMSKNLNAAENIGGKYVTVVLRATKFNPHKKTMKIAIIVCLFLNYNPILRSDYSIRFVVI
jgi:hypothetical protein